MNAVIGALVLFGLAAFVASAAYDNYRIGKMQVVSKGLSPLFDRIADAPFFWGATLINGVLTTTCAVGGLALLAGSFIR